MFIFHQDNKGRELVVKGRRDTISYVSASGEWFRVEGDKHNSVSTGLRLEDIQMAESLTISLNGKVWHHVAIQREDFDPASLNEK